MNRGGFNFKDDGTSVNDPRTDLTWLRNANVFGKQMCWNSAMTEIAKMNLDRYAGLTGWRLPDIKDLKVISMYGVKANSDNDEKYILSEYFNDLGFNNVMPGWYWSSTPYSGLPNSDPDKYKLAISMNEPLDGDDPFEVTDKCYVWPVCDET